MSIMEPRMLRRPNIDVKSEVICISTGLIYLCFACEYRDGGPAIYFDGL